MPKSTRLREVSEEVPKNYEQQNKEFRRKIICMLDDTNCTAALSDMFVLVRMIHNQYHLGRFD